ncbi:MAG: pyrroline-5-carboxylate reductase [Candidatus Omnitrophica bacterium]|nr:pyrroline-5-carboxylate reductase [Candidatus Omnitrophota bacterium]HOX54424.1 pyrroline-5-carboxylate reductase [Candidatus Omnitrophota bacterium]
MYNKIGIIGCGNMGRAIFERLKDDYSLLVFDKDSVKTRDLSSGNVAKNIADLLNKSEAVILAIKPQDFESSLKELKDDIDNKLVISIAAGITMEYIQKILGKVKVIRVMPNMPAKIGKGMSCLAKGKFASDEDLDFAKFVFDQLGETLILKEDMIDAATAISGSGPGYFYDLSEGKDLKEIKDYEQDFVTKLISSAESIGFSKLEAEVLAKVTAEGSIAYLEKAKLSPQEAKKQVVSKGGTTEAALEVLHKGGSLEAAVKAALKRAKELSKKG